MNFRDFKFLCDENVAPEIILFLQAQQIDATSVREFNLLATSDRIILSKAFELKRVVITHDRDFGKIVYSGEIEFLGLIYLRPGHFDASFHIRTLEALIAQDLSFEPPFIAIAEQKQAGIKIRLRNLL